MENLVLFSGEERTLQLIVSNRGSVPAVFTSITCVSEVSLTLVTTLQLSQDLHTVICIFICNNAVLLAIFNFK